MKYPMIMKFKKCPNCKGDGFVLRHERQGGQWSLKPFAKTCSRCFGTGKIVKP
jgi:DnaJ-class molecular chaperone